MLRAIHQSTQARVTAVVLIFALTTIGWPRTIAAQAQTSSGLPGSLDDVPELIKTARYGLAIDVLKREIETSRSRADFSALGLAYLLLVKTYIIRGNLDVQREPETADLYYNEARESIRDCLSIHELRDTRPDPPKEYPPEMIAMFDLVRNEMFGSFRIVDLEPPDAVVVLDGDTLVAVTRAASGSSEGEPGSAPVSATYVSTNVPIGAHEIVVAAQGHRTLNDPIIISPGGTLEKSYALSKSRGTWWWVTWGSVAAVGTAGLAWALTGSSDEQPGPTGPPPLPGPPPPPD